MQSIKLSVTDYRSTFSKSEFSGRALDRDRISAFISYQVALDLRGRERLAVDLFDVDNKFAARPNQVCAFVNA